MGRMKGPTNERENSRRLKLGTESFSPTRAPLSGPLSTEVFMSATAPLSKLAELRAKTDQDLVRIIDNAMEVGFLLVATDRHVDSAKQLHGRAEEIYANSLMLLPKVEDVNERRRLEGRLNQLRESLDRRQAKGAQAGS